MNIPELIDQIRLESEEELNKFLKGLNAEKIIQFLIAPDNSTYQGRVFGLSSNGTLYSVNHKGEWEIYAPPLTQPSS